MFISVRRVVPRMLTKTKKKSAAFHVKATFCSFTPKPNSYFIFFSPWRDGNNRFTRIKQNKIKKLSTTTEMSTAKKKKIITIINDMIYIIL